VADLQSATAPPEKPCIHGNPGEPAEPLTVLLTGAAESDCERVRVSDPDLARIADAWPALPEHIKAAIISLVATAPKPGGSKRRRR
jgi:hypothetical protein